MSKLLDTLNGQRIVVDTNSPMCYIGTLEAYDEHYITLRDADVVNCEESNVAKNYHICECARDGYVPNRKYVHILISAVVSLSRLEDIKIF